MSTEGTSAQRRTAVARVATEVFGTAVAEESVIGETLIRATDEDAGPVTPRELTRPPRLPATATWSATRSLPGSRPRSAWTATTRATFPGASR